MDLELLKDKFAIYKVKNLADVDISSNFTFLSITDNELSVIAPMNSIHKYTDISNDWLGFRIVGKLEFTMVGILAAISEVLANNAIPICAVSTYDTDYFFYNSENHEKVVSSLTSAGYTFL